MTFLFIYDLKSQDLLKTVIIDPGHGGKDPGNLGTEKFNLKEKDIVLNVSLLLGEKIKDSFPEINVVYTREKDVFVPLHKRTKIANNNNGDLFISIHCNWWKNEDACGIETYVMGVNKFEQNLDIVKKENSVIYLENNYSKNYDGFDPESVESLIALTLYQDNNFNNSINFSNKVQFELIKNTNSKNRGVKQAPFWVISRVNMPSVLLEVGFLTCPSEEKYLNSKLGQENIANSIFQGFVNYKNDFLKSDSISSDKLKEEVLDTTQEEIVIKNNSVAEDTDNIKYQNFLFKIQIGVYSEKNTDLELKLIENSISFEVFFDRELYKYFVGHSDKINVAEEILDKMINLGFNDSFIISNNN